MNNLLLYLKRLTFDDVKKRAVSDDEAYKILEEIEQLLTASQKSKITIDDVINIIK